jgi:hypothetical protein
VSIKLLRGGFNRDGFKIASFPYFQDFVTAPTNRQKIEAQKTYDIIHPIIRGYSVDFCYLSLVLKLQKSCDTRLVSVEILWLCYWQEI